LCTWNSLS